MQIIENLRYTGQQLYTYCDVKSLVFAKSGTGQLELWQKVAAMSAYALSALALVASFFAGSSLYFGGSAFLFFWNSHCVKLIKANQELTQKNTELSQLGKVSVDLKKSTEKIEEKAQQLQKVTDELNNLKGVIAAFLSDLPGKVEVLIRDNLTTGVAGIADKVKEQLGPMLNPLVEAFTGFKNVSEELKILLTKNNELLDRVSKWDAQKLKEIDACEAKASALIRQLGDLKGLIDEASSKLREHNKDLGSSTDAHASRIKDLTLKLDALLRNQVERLDSMGVAQATA